MIFISLNIKYISSFIVLMFKQLIFMYHRHFTITLKKILIIKLKNNHPFLREKHISTYIRLYLWNHCKHNKEQLTRAFDNLIHPTR